MKDGIRHAKCVRTSSAFLAGLAGLLCLFAGGSVRAEGQANIKIGYVSLHDQNNAAEWQTRGFYNELKKNGLIGGYVSLQGTQHGATADRVYALFKPFHAIYIERTPYATRMDKNVAQAYREGLRRYLEAGGGVLLGPTLGEYWSDEGVNSFNMIFKDFGVEMYAEAICDLKRMYTDPLCRALRGTRYSEFFWTTNIAPHPVTQGVKTLFLPQFGWGGMWGTVALAYSKDWTVVVRGMESAASYACPANWTEMKCGPFETIGVVGHCPSAPPIAAVRTIGAGRLMAYACNSMYISENYGVKIWPYVHEFRGDPATSMPSDGMKLVINSLKWLAEPALAKPELGSYTDHPPTPVTFAASVNWDEHKFPKPLEKQPAGLIGVHSDLSDGKGTVAEYAAAAKAAGLQYLVFTESLEAMTPEKLELLKQRCAAASDGTFYACPGLELTDGDGLRWAFWAERIQWPKAHLLSADGKRLKMWGQYQIANGWMPVALLTYKALPGDPSNLWWYYIVPVRVYNGGQLQEDNMQQWLFALADLRFVAPIIYTRIHAPAEVAAAKNVGENRLLHSQVMSDVKKWLNSSFSSQWDRNYLTEGPAIHQWACLNNQMENPWWITAGAQRVRLAFDVSSPAGIKEVIVHDADRGPIRRFLADGQPRFSREFELVQDKERELTLEVVDAQGKRAVSPYIFVYCYKAGLYRCGDNLNMLGSAAILTHPNFGMFVNSKVFENNSSLTIKGIDSGSGVLTQPDQNNPWDVHTTEGDHYSHGGRMLQTPLRVPFSSYGITQMDAEITHFTNYGKDDHSFNGGSFWRRADPLPFATFARTAWLLQSRMNYFTAWNFRRVVEGAKDYEGGVIIHEDTIRFTKDVTLSYTPGVEMEAQFTQFTAADGLWNQVYVSDADLGNLFYTLQPDEKLIRFGRLRPGGYCTVMPTDAGYLAFLVSNSTEGFTYRFSTEGKSGAVVLRFGYGGAKQAFKAGDAVTLRYLTLTMPASCHRQNNEDLEYLSRLFNMTGGADGYPVRVELGGLKGTQIFLDISAKDHEAVFSAGPAKSICDMPVRVNGIEDNGCAAVYVTNGTGNTQRFRFIAVDKDIAYLQIPLDNRRLWVGNAFVADQKALKITLVVDGQAPQSLPLLEVHNPTDAPITARITSPSKTPLFAGISQSVTVPAGNSRFYTIHGKEFVEKAP